jgi:hypothetical protein
MATNRLLLRSKYLKTLVFQIELPSVLLVIGKSRLQRSHMLVEKQHENEYAGSSGAACLKNYSLRDLMFVMNATLLRHGMGSCSLTRAAGFVRWR